MRIALVNLGRTGAGPLYSLEIAKQLARDCELLSVISAGAYNLEDWRASGLWVESVPTYDGLLSFMAATADPRRHWRIRRVLHAFQPDALYYPMIHPWCPIVSALAHHTPSVLTLHDPTLHEGEENLVFDFLQRLAVRQANRVIVLSKVFVEGLVARGIPPSRVDVIPLGEMSYYGRVRTTAVDERAHRPTILFLGRILPYKGLDTLFEAFSRIQEAVPKVRLLVVGEGDLSPYQGYLSRLSEVEVHNRWIGDEEVAGFFMQADVVAVPYRSATQSLAVPAAYAFSTPVVASAVGGIPEQVKDGVTGILVAPRAVDAFADACIRLLKAPALAAQMGRAGKEFAEAEWSWGAIADRVLRSCRAAAADMSTP